MHTSSVIFINSKEIELDVVDDITRMSDNDNLSAALAAINSRSDAAKKEKAKSKDKGLKARLKVQQSS